MSDTPRTNAATRMAFSGEHMVPIVDAQKLELELYDVTKQRDDLSAACSRLFRVQVTFDTVIYAADEKAAQTPAPSKPEPITNKQP